MRTNLMWPRSHAFVLVICCCQFLALGQSTMTLSQLTSPAEQQPSPNAVPNDNELTTQPPASQPGQPRPVRSKTPPTPRERAWQLLESACASDKTTDRATATLVLGLIPNNVKSARLAEKALTDDKAEVRSAAAAALGEMKSRASIPKLRAAFDDQDPLVVLAAAHSLDLMHDSSAYEVYYEVLNGERKASKGLISSQASLFHDPKRVAALGFEQGIGFIPFAGIGWGAIKAIAKDDSSPIRAAAAKVLARDPDPATTTALTDAAGDKSWIVQTAALEALAKRGDRSALNTVEKYMADEKDAVRYTAAAAVVRLTVIKEASKSDRRR
jgi:HEAT repeat protein